MTRNSPDQPNSPAREVEHIARHAYGRVLAVLACATRDINAAEDALADALVEALSAWLRDGVPANPEGWLVVAARRNLLDQRRAVAAARRVWQDPGVAQRLQDMLASRARPEARLATGPNPGSKEQAVDDRLRMMFACTHPSLEASVHAPLMLQSLLGLSAARIAGAFLVAPAAMSQRLVRAKTKLREEGVDFSMPGRVELVSRLPRVLEAIYAAYSASHDDAVEAGVASELADEAVDLARLVTDLLDDQPEAWGLRSLVVLSRARRDARRDGKGRYVPLPDQDCDLWDRELVQEGEWCLLQAAEKGPGSAGRFALQAAIQSVHVDRMRTGQINWTAIVGFYEALLAHSPSVGATIGLSAGLLMRGDPHRALLLLDGLPMNRVKSHQPFWAVRAETLRALGRFDKSSEAFQLAIGLSRDAAVRAYLLEQQTQMRS